VTASDFNELRHDIADRPRRIDLMSASGAGSYRQPLVARET